MTSFPFLKQVASCRVSVSVDVQSLPLDAYARVLFRVCRGCLGLQGHALNRASRQDTALMLKTRAQYVPWSPRQPLQTLNSTRAQASKGRLWTSTLTEPVKLATYFKNGNEVAGGSSQAHARCWACPQSRSPRVNGVQILVRGACRTRRRSQP